MKTIKNRLLLLCLSLVALAGLTSCGDGSYEYCPIQGRWTLGQIDGVPVPDEDLVEFTFLSDGTGFYGYYQFNPYHYLDWTTTPIEWELRYGSGGAEYLYIYPRYSNDVWIYIVKLYTSTMKLIDVETGQELMFYDLSMP